MPSGFAVETLMSWVDEGMEPEAVIYAIKKAALADKRRIDYINSILVGWARQGIKSLDQAEAAERDFQERKNSRMPRAPNEPKERKPTDDELAMAALIQEVGGG